MRARITLLRRSGGYLTRTRRVPWATTPAVPRAVVVTVQVALVSLMVQRYFLRTTLLVFLFLTGVIRHRPVALFTVAISRKP